MYLLRIGTGGPVSGSSPTEVASSVGPNEVFAQGAASPFERECSIWILLSTPMGLTRRLVYYARKNIGDGMNVDVYVYAGAISMGGYELMCERLSNGKQHERALLVLATPGGDPHAGFRIARAMQHVYDKFDVLVPRYCKSAGTLVALGANSLYLDDMSELGPLDIQVKKNDEVVGRNSGLDIIQAVNYLQNQTLIAFQSYLGSLTQDVGLSTKVASDISSRLTTGLFEPISAQIDPVRLAEMQRATEVAFEYGSRLAHTGTNLKSSGLTQLVNGYPSHGFVIDRKEAKTIFNRVHKPEGFLAQFSQAVRDATEGNINAKQPIVQRFPLDLNLDGDHHEQPAGEANATSGAEISQGCEPSVNGDSTADGGSPVAPAGESIPTDGRSDTSKPNSGSTNAAH